VFKQISVQLLRDLHPLVIQCESNYKFMSRHADCRVPSLLIEVPEQLDMALPALRLAITTLACPPVDGSPRAVCMDCGSERFRPIDLNVTMLALQAGN